ncbi:hypothetical protein ACUL41_06260 [Virgibacillus natechei]
MKNISFKSSLLMLLGTLIGFTIVFFAKGFWKDNFIWGEWLAWMTGGIIGYLIIFLLLILMNRKKDNK